VFIDVELVDEGEERKRIGRMQGKEHEGHSDEVSNILVLVWTWDAQTHARTLKDASALTYAHAIQNPQVKRRLLERSGKDGQFKVTHVIIIVVIITMTVIYIIIVITIIVINITIATPSSQSTF
jgi:hypothetical protein